MINSAFDSDSLLRVNIHFQPRRQAALRVMICQMQVGQFILKDREPIDLVTVCISVSFEWCLTFLN